MKSQILFLVLAGLWKCLNTYQVIFLQSVPSWGNFPPLPVLHMQEETRANLPKGNGIPNRGLSQEQVSPVEDFPSPTALMTTTSLSALVTMVR